MHGLVNKAVEAFIANTYGPQAWLNIARLADLPDVHFEEMLQYDLGTTVTVIDCAADHLRMDRSELLENLGTYLVSHPSAQALRRLLRFGGVSFVDFLHSLDDLHDRARLAVSDLALPMLELREHTSTQFSLSVRSEIDGAGHVMVGLLRAMADDYGALAMLEHGGRVGGVESVSISLLEISFAEGNHFALQPGA